MGQSVDSVLLLIQDYTSAVSEKDKYETIIDLMEKDALLDLQDLEEIERFCHQSEKQFGDKVFSVLRNMVTADVYYYQNLLDSSIFHYTEQGKLAELNSDYLLAAFGYGNAGYTFEQEGKLSEALYYRKKAVQLSNLAEDPKVKADAYYNIGKLYEKLSRPDSSIFYIQKTIEIDKESNNIQGMIHNLLFLIQQYLSVNNLEQAEILCDECLMHSKNINYLRGLAMCHHLAAETDLFTGNIDSALNHINLALEIDENRNDFTRYAQFL